LTAGSAAGSIVGVGLLVGELVTEVAGGFEAVGFTTTSAPPQAPVAETAATTATATKLRFINV